MRGTYMCRGRDTEERMTKKLKFANDLAVCRFRAGYVNLAPQIIDAFWRHANLQRCIWNCIEQSQSLLGGVGCNWETDHLHQPGAKPPWGHSLEPNLTEKVAQRTQPHSKSPNPPNGLFTGVSAHGWPTWGRQWTWRQWKWWWLALKRFSKRLALPK